MSLDIGIGKSSTSGFVKGEPLLSLDDDGYYWFLHPFFERLAADTGQYIDLYDHASFSEQDVVALEQMLLTVRAHVESQPDTWEVCVGTQATPDTPDVKEVYKTVQRELFMDLIARFQQVITRAKELGRPVVCLGD